MVVDKAFQHILKLSDRHSLQFPLHLDVCLLHDVAKLFHRVHHKVPAARPVLLDERNLLAKKAISQDREQFSN